MRRLLTLALVSLPVVALAQPVDEPGSPVALRDTYGHPYTPANPFPTSAGNASVGTVGAPNTSATTVQNPDGTTINGTDNPSVANPGGTGVRGWLSNIWAALTNGTLRGSVGGFTGTAQVTPAVTTTAYAAGQSVGGIQTLALTRVGQTSGYVQGMTVTFNDAQTPGGALDLVLFSSNPTASTTTDHSAVNIVPADLGKLIPGGVLHFTDCTTLGTGTACQLQNVSIPYVVATTAAPIYGLLVTRAALTLGSATDIIENATGTQN
ncbi:MAG: hypothetical protein ACRYGG_06175 [Janthinobacterium lividum]